MHACKHVYSCMHTYMHVCMHICLCVQIYIHVCVYMHICVYTHYSHLSACITNNLLLSMSYVAEDCTTNSGGNSGVYLRTCTRHTRNIFHLHEASTKHLKFLPFHICKCICIYRCKGVHVYRCIHTYIQTSACMYMYMRIYVYIYIYMDPM